MRNELNSMIIQKFKPDYIKSSKLQKSNILDQLQELTKMDRKHLIKPLRGKRQIINNE